MTTQTEIMNWALTEIGAALIGSPGENREQAKRAQLMFPFVVRSEFRKHAWSCAMARALLPATGNTPAYEFLYEYNLPSECLRIWMVNDQYQYQVLREYVNSTLVPFTIEGRKLLTNFVAPVKLRFIQDLQNDISTWDSTLQEVIALRLALKLIPATVRSDTKYRLIFDQYKDVMRAARRINAIELPPVPLPDDSWIFGRL